MPKLNLTGQKFNNLTVLHESPPHKTLGGKLCRKWFCQCDCGNYVNVIQDKLRNNRTKSCGCLKKKVAAENGKKSSTHGMSNHPLYPIWNSMIYRCNNIKCKEYKFYGGRGIKVCQRWLDVKNFIEDMKNRPEGASLDRIDNDGDYSLNNCRWSTQSEQSRNRRTNINFTIDGITKCLTDWANDCGVDPKLASQRVKNGWTIEQALELKNER